MKSRQSACRNLRTEVVNTFDDSPVSAFAYDYDAAGRRIQRLDGRANPPDEPLAVTNIFAYNQLSELTGAVMPALIPAGDTNTFAYQYDPIGNRQWARANEVTNLYQANELNQYTNINQGAVEPVYDLDGNMTQLGPWAYDWDGENRLISVSSNGVPVVQNQYDYMSRRVMKATATQTNTFLYDGWNLVREDLGAATPSSRSYVWGLDLSGTLQGAGGVGGLLAILSSDSCLLTPAYDANGNIADLVDDAGIIAAHYEYDPFGNSIVQSGDYADDNPFRFSTKYCDDDTGLYYYGIRFYSPGLGRFLSRDPIGELGGHNLYVFVRNNAIKHIDPFGLIEWRELAFNLLVAIGKAEWEFISCLDDIISALSAGSDAGSTFQSLIDQNYQCCSKYKGKSQVSACCETWTPIAEYSQGGGERTWSLGHQLWGCEMKNNGVDRDCLGLINALWESYEIIRGDLDEASSTLSYLFDTLGDIEDVYSGFDNAPDDCNDLTPSNCEARPKE